MTDISYNITQRHDFSSKSPIRSIGYETLNTKKPLLECLDDLATSFFEKSHLNDYGGLSEITKQIRVHITKEEIYLIDEVISTGIVLQLIRFLEPGYSNNEQLITECAHFVANITSGKPEHVVYVLELDVISKALNLLTYPSEEVKDSAMFILANISGESFASRDIIIERGVVPKLVSLLEDETHSRAFITHIAWLISNLVRGTPYPAFEDVKPLLPSLKKFMEEKDHEEELMNYALWSLSYMSDGDDEQISAILNLDVTSQIISYMTFPEPCIKAPALRTAGNLLTGTADVVDVLIEHDVIPGLSKMLNDPKRVFRKEACWSLSNIFAANSSHIEAIFSYKDHKIVKKLIRMIYDDSSPVAREGLFCLTNACSEGNSSHIQILVEYGLIELIVDTLRNTEDSTVITICLEGLENIIEHRHLDFENGNLYLARLINNEGLRVIEDLQNSCDNQIYESATIFIDRFFGEPLKKEL